MAKVHAMYQVLFTEIGKLKLLAVNTDSGLIQAPIKLKGGALQVEALCLFLWFSLKEDNFSLVLGNFASTKSKLTLPHEICSPNGVHEVQAKGRSALLYVKWDERKEEFLCDFGYSPHGLTVRATGNGFSVGSMPKSQIAAIADCSLAFLAQASGNTSYLASLATLREVAAGDSNEIITNSVDPLGYYYLLGLNPWMILNFAPDMIDAIVKGIELVIIANLRNPDIVPAEMYQLESKLIACAILGDPDMRERYTTWIK